MEDGTIDVVRGKDVVPTPAAQFRRAVDAHARVVIDVGAGDGRAMYRLARAHPEWLCIAMDAAAEGLRDVSRRAGRKQSRGGAPNVWCVRGRAEAPPKPLRGLADLVVVDYPWGPLLQGLISPDPAMVAAIGSLGRPGAAFQVRINASALQNNGEAGLWPQGNGQEVWQSRLSPAYAAAGVRLLCCEGRRQAPETSWGRRLSGRGLLAVLVLEGIVTGGEDTNAVVGRNSAATAVNQEVLDTR